MWTDLLFYGSVALLAIGCVLHVLAAMAEDVAAMAEDVDALERLALDPHDIDENGQGDRR